MKRMHINRLFFTGILALSFVCGASVLAQDSLFIRDHYTKSEYRIPMRDGVKLFTSVYVPRDTTRSYPIIMTRTPYSVRPYGEDAYPGSVGNQRRKYFREGYIVVYQDVRGTYMSEGNYVNVRPYVHEKKSRADIDETTDTYDTVDWLIHNVRHNNGRVGVSGISYPGFYANMAAIDAHPAMKAVSPQAPVSAWMLGDDFYHNGAMLLPHAFDFFSGFGKARPSLTKERSWAFNHKTPDGYKFFLELGALPNANTKYLKDSVAFWNEVMEHGAWDTYWEARSVLPHLRNITPAMMYVGGWFDTENLWGALNAYAEVEKNNPSTTNILVMGPWSHGQWAWNDGDSLGDIRYGSKTSLFYTDSVEFPFFDYHLKGNGKATQWEAAVYETGANQWRFLDAWPPRNAQPLDMRIQEGGKLILGQTGPASTGYDEYVSDPSKPVPYTSQIVHWYNASFMCADQRFASTRPDVLVYQTDTLKEDVRIAGPILVHLFGSTSGTDCDWVVKVIDVYPDHIADDSTTAGESKLEGYERLVRGDVLRGKFRNNLAKPEPLVPNQVTPFNFKLQDAFHTFKRGHRIMIHVQSTWFPMIDRNPGKFLDIYHARDSDFQKTVQRLYHSKEFPSHITFSVLG